MPYPTEWEKTLRQYSEELRRFQQRSTLEKPAVTPAAVSNEEVRPAPIEKTVAAQPIAAERVEPAPTPPFGNGENGTARPPAEVLAGFNDQASQAETDRGTLVVRLISARGTIPVVGATVAVFRANVDGNQLLYLGQTDENGESPTWTLPTRDRSLSLEPGTTMPYVNYAVQANAVGYLAVLNEGVSVFGGVKTVQRITMLPLPEPATVFEDTTLVIRPQNPENELNEKEEDDGI